MQLPRVGVVRLAENARRLERLVAKGRARVKSATVSLRAGKLSVSLQVEVLRPQANHRPAKPGSRVGIDLGTRWLAVVASADGTVLERVGMPAPLKASLTELRRLDRRHARSRKCSNRRHELKRQISAAHARVADIRGDALHKLTTRLAKTHGVIAIEDLHIAALMQQTGPGARARKQALADAALGELRRQLAYKCGWYGSRLVVVPVLTDVPPLRPPPKDRPTRALDLRGVRHHAPPRRQRRHKPGPVRARPATAGTGPAGRAAELPLRSLPNTAG